MPTYKSLERDKVRYPKQCRQNKDDNIHKSESTLKWKYKRTLTFVN